jgi:hypothetical protein
MQVILKPGLEIMVDGEALFVIRAADYARLIEAAEGDDMIVHCKTCGAWFDRDDPACATTEDFTGCWAAATGGKHDTKNCRRDRVCEVKP